MQPDETIQGDRDFSKDAPLSLKIGTKADSTVDPIFEDQSRIISGHMRRPTINTETESSFSEQTDPRQAVRTMASNVICRLLIWMADGRTLEDRGLRASIALYCIRPDLIDGATLDQIGTLAGCSRQAVHKLASAFRQTTGMQE
jgi:hypothetical protein